MMAIGNPGDRSASTIPATGSTAHRTVASAGTSHSAMNREPTAIQPLRMPFEVMWRLRKCHNLVDSPKRSQTRISGMRITMTSLHTGKCLLIVSLCVSCCALTGCDESTFTLASESRLPQWFTPPPELTRGDVSVTLSYYTIGDAKAVLRDAKGRKIAEIRCKVVNPHPWRGYPAYVALAANGRTEIIEHIKMEPLFYVNDDPAVRSF